MSHRGFRPHAIPFANVYDFNNQSGIKNIVDNAVCAYPYTVTVSAGKFFCNRKDGDFQQVLLLP